jgi:hypothetical protein
MTRSPNAQRALPCMPPLLEEETKPLSPKLGHTSFGGSACENLVKFYFLSQKINVSEPYVDDGVDLIIEKPEGWVRGQVKKIIYQSKIVWVKQDTDKKTYTSTFDFNFQSGGKSGRAYPNGRRQRGPNEVDYYYHVLLTPYRQLIWETPVSLIPLREDGFFIQGKSVNLDKEYWIRKKSEIDFNKLLVYSRYDPILFKTYPDFFLKQEQQTLESLFYYE